MVRAFLYLFSLVSTFIAWFAKIIYFPALQHLSRTVELSRVHLFSIITQYRAVFGDSEADISHSSCNYNTQFYSWIMEKVCSYILYLMEKCFVCWKWEADSYHIFLLKY